MGAPEVEVLHAAMHWQDVAAVADDVLTEYVAKAEEPTRARLLTLVRDAEARVRPPGPPRRLR